MLEIGLGVGIFSAVVMFLAMVIVIARSKLMPTGTITITINDTTSVQAPYGAKLLSALSEGGVHLPSACGGIGTCGLCRVEVLQGGGPILPVEKGRITRREIARGNRLACQVVVRETMKVRVSEDILGAQEWCCTVRSTRNVTTLIKEVVLELPQGEAMAFRAGAFVQLTCPPFSVRFAEFHIESEYRDLWNKLDLWRYEVVCNEAQTRAYSMANYPDEKGIIILNVRIALPPPGTDDLVPPGMVSSYIFGLKSGNNVTISGPFGHFYAAESSKEMIFVGGGTGMAPMRAHIFDQLKCLGTRRKITYWYGARNHRELFYKEKFDRLQQEHDNFEWFIAFSDPQPEDSGNGYTGFIHRVLYENYLKDHSAPEDCEYYVCGPRMMIEAVVKMLDSLGVEPENILYDDFGS